MRINFRTISLLRAAFTNDLKEFGQSLDNFAGCNESYLKWKLSYMDDLSLYQALLNLEEEMQEYEEQNQCRLNMPIEYRLMRKEYKTRTGRNWDEDSYDISCAYDWLLERLSNYTEGYRPPYMCVCGYTAKEDWVWENANLEE